MLPDFLRLAPGACCSTPRRGKENGGALTSAHHSLSLDSAHHGLSPIPRAPPPWKGHSVQMLEDESLGDLTLVGEGDITSPNSTLLPPSPLPGLSHTRHAPPSDSRADPRSSSGTSGV